MRFIDRLIVFIFALLLIAVAAAGALFSFMPGSSAYYLDWLTDVLGGYRWFVLAGAAVLLVLALFIMFGSAFHHNRQSKSSTIKAGDSGDNIQISVGAIDCIVGQVVKGYDQVKSVHTVVSETPDGVKVKAKTVVNGDINIPQLAKLLQDDIRIQLESMVGLKVKDVSIIVTDVVAKPINVVKPAENEWDDVEDGAKETAEAADSTVQAEAADDK